MNTKTRIETPLRRALSAHTLPLVAMMLALGCLPGCTGSDSPDITPPRITSGPTIQMDPNGNTPLAGVLSVSTSEPTRIVLDIDYEGDGHTIEFDGFSNDHSLPVLGLHPDETHTIVVMAIDRAGNETTDDTVLMVTTGPLPEDFPELVTEVSSPGEMEPGVTLFAARGFLIILDGTGEVVWYHRVGLPGGPDRDVRRLPNGNLLLLLSFSRIIEIDMLGGLVQTWSSILPGDAEEDSTPVDANAFHHEVFGMENGNLLTLSMEVRDIDHFPTSDSDPLAPTATTPVGGDVVVEFQRDGTIVNKWPLLDMLDPLRIGYDAVFDLNRFFLVFPDIEGVIADWTHGNAVIHDPSDDSIVVSARHQDAVFKFSRLTGELIWILGPHENWDPEGFGDLLLEPTNPGEFFWPYHQHAPVFTPEGNILIFDNGNYRASPFDAKLPADMNFSRAVEYEIDVEDMEITQVWSYGQFAEATIFTPFIGDADYMTATGNVLITFGGIITPMLNARIVEVTHETPAEVVFEVHIVDSIVYRSERLPRLYP